MLNGPVFASIFDQLSLLLCVDNSRIVTFIQQYNKMMSKMNLKKDKISGIQKALKAADKDKDKKIDIGEFRTELKL